MVAVEGAKAQADGSFCNEFPDHVADLVIFAGLGYGIGQPGLGWAAAFLAVPTAYMRELGRVPSSSVKARRRKSGFVNAKAVRA